MKVSSLKFLLASLLFLSCKDKATFQAGGGSADCMVKTLPIRMAIVVDVSSSMEQSLSLVKGNITAVVQRLSNIRPEGSSTPVTDVAVGVVAYSDPARVRRVIPLTQDLSSLSTQLNAIPIQNDPENQDGPEEGLAAADEALNILTVGNNTQDTVTILLVVSDNYAHNGWIGNQQRDYSTSQLNLLLNGERFRYFQLYDATPVIQPDNSRYLQVNQPQGPPSTQWEEVRRVWKDLHPDATRSAGAGLGFPFNAATLVERLPTEIAAKLKICR